MRENRRELRRIIITASYAVKSTMLCAIDIVTKRLLQLRDLDKNDTISIIANAARAKAAGRNQSYCGLISSQVVVTSERWWRRLGVSSMSYISTFQHER